MKMLFDLVNKFFNVIINFLYEYTEVQVIFI